MCLSPILIDNPYRGLKHVGLNWLHDTTSLKIPVPCGNCASCIALRQNYFIQRTHMEAINNHLFMVTLTYKDSMIRFKKVNGRKLYYADFTDVQKMFKRFRNSGHKFKYLCVSEYGTRKHRPHFHLLFSVPKQKGDNFLTCLNLEAKYKKLFSREWRRNVGSDRVPIYKHLCEFIDCSRGRTFDFHYVNANASMEGEADVAFYVTKYLFKADVWVDNLKSALKLNLEPDEFQDIWKILRPRMCISKSWGHPDDPDVYNHIRKGIDISKEVHSEFPFFVSPTIGQTFPLSPFYQRKCLTMEDKLSFFFFSKRQITDDGTIDSDERSVNHVNVASERLKRIRTLINNRLISDLNVYDFQQIENLAFEELDKPDCIPRLVDDSWSNDFED